MKCFVIAACSLFVGILIGSILSAAIWLTPTESASPSAENEALLLQAVWNNDLQRVSQIFDESELDIDAQLDTEGLTALMIACRLGNRVTLIQQLLAKGASLDARAKNGNTAVHFVAGCGDLESVAALVKAMPGPVRSDPGEWTPLHEAAGGSDHSVVRTLVDAGYNVNASGPDGMTPLMVAATHGSRAVVSTLMAAGASPLATNKFGHTALDFAKVRVSRGESGQDPTDVTDLLQ